MPPISVIWFSWNVRVYFINHIVNLASFCFTECIIKYGIILVLLFISNCIYLWFVGFNVWWYWDIYGIFLKSIEVHCRVSTCHLISIVLFYLKYDETSCKRKGISANLIGLTCVECMAGD